MSTSTLKPGNGVLLDTTVVVHHFRAAHVQLKNFLQTGGTAYLPLTALAELHSGACRVARKDRVLRQIETFLLTVVTLLPGEATAITFGESMRNWPWPAPPSLKTIFGSQPKPANMGCLWPPPTLTLAGYRN